MKAPMAGLMAMMLTHNDAGRYIHEVIKHLTRYVDKIVVLDDASTDSTPEICLSFAKVKLYRNRENLFSRDESILRSKLWGLTVKENPAWVLAIDSDEIFEERMVHEAAGLIDQDEFDVVEFRIFDFWQGFTHYRIDGGWNPWVKKLRMLFRYRSGQTYSWPAKRFHCSRVPGEVFNIARVYQSDLRVKHYGWARREDVLEKYIKYREISCDAHLESVLADPEKVKLEEWIPGKILPF